MDAIQNPYTPGAGTPPRYLAGREDLLNAFRTMIGRAEIGNSVQPIVLSGLRGVGKTVLLLKWREMAEEKGWVTAHLEVRPGADLRGQLSDAAVEMLRQVSRRYRNKERVEHLKRVTASFLRALGPTLGRGGVTLEVNPEPGIADSGLLETDLIELLVEIGTAAREEGSGAILFIDEMQDASGEQLAAIVGACHRLNQETLPMLIVGAGLPTIGRVLSEARSYSERLFDLQTVGPLTSPAENEAVVAPAEPLNVHFTIEALEALATLAGGYPFFIQTYAKFVWDVALDETIDRTEVDLAVPKAQEQLRRSFFTPRYDRATPAERKYMHGMAAVGDGAVPTSEVATILKRKPSDISVQRDGLMSKGLVYSPERGLVAFTVPHMAEFLRSLPTHELGEP